MDTNQVVSPEARSAANRLLRSLCHELAQAERSARAHPSREAHRLGDVPPARALLAISSHARAVEPRLRTLLESRITTRTLGEIAGESLSAIRHLVIDRVLTTQQSYRFTLVGVTHGVDVARLLQAVAEKVDDLHLGSFCQEVVAERTVLLDAARAQLDWFAREPAEAQLSGLRRLFRRPRRPVLDTGNAPST